MRRSKLNLASLVVVLVVVAAANVAAAAEDKEEKGKEEGPAEEPQKEKGDDGGKNVAAAPKFSYRADSAWLDLTYKVPMNITFYEVISSTDGGGGSEKGEDDKEAAGKVEGAEERGKLMQFGGTVDDAWQLENKL